MKNRHYALGLVAFFIVDSAIVFFGPKSGFSNIRIGINLFIAVILFLVWWFYIKTPKNPN